MVFVSNSLCLLPFFYLFFFTFRLDSGKEPDWHSFGGIYFGGIYFGGIYVAFNSGGNLRGCRFLFDYLLLRRLCLLLAQYLRVSICLPVPSRMLHPCSIPVL